MKVGDFDVEVTTERVGDGWQSTAILPDGQKVISAPTSSREDAEHDIEQQAKARLYPHRKYDVNRPVESMNIDEEAKLGTGARFAKLKGSLAHQKGIKNPGAVAAAIGREKYGKKRFQKLASKGRHESLERKYLDLTPADEAIVIHQADKLLEDIPTYEISPEGEEVTRPECPYCGGHGEEVQRGRYRCMNCGSVFVADLSKYASYPHAKASFYPGSGGSAGVGGTTSV